MITSTDHGPLKKKNLRNGYSPIEPGEYITSVGKFSEFGSSESHHPGYTRLSMHWREGDQKSTKYIRHLLGSYYGNKPIATDFVRFTWQVGNHTEQRIGLPIYAFLGCSLQCYLADGTIDVPLGYQPSRMTAKLTPRGDLKFQDPFKHAGLVVGGLATVQDQAVHVERALRGPAVSCSFINRFEACRIDTTCELFRFCSDQEAILSAALMGASK